MLVLERLPGTWDTGSVRPILRSSILALCALLPACASTPHSVPTRPLAGLCFDFGAFEPGHLPIGFLAEATNARPGSKAFRVLPARASSLRAAPDAEGQRGRGIQVLAQEGSQIVLWLIAARFGDAHVTLFLHALNADSKLGLVLAPGATVDAEAPLPERRVFVLWDPRRKAILVRDSAGLGADPTKTAAREIARQAVFEEQRSRHTLELVRRGAELEIRFDRGVPLRVSLADFEASFSLGLSLRGAAVFDALWIS